MSIEAKSAYDVTGKPGSAALVMELLLACIEQLNGKVKVSYKALGYIEDRMRKGAQLRMLIDRDANGEPVEITVSVVDSISTVN